MTEPAKWIVDAQPVLALADWPLAERSAAELDELIALLNLQAFAALARASTDAEEKETSE